MRITIPSNDTQAREVAEQHYLSGWALAGYVAREVVLLSHFTCLSVIRWDRDPHDSSFLLEAKVVADPALTFGQSGTAICKMRVVANDRRKNPQTGEWEDTDTLWMDVTCFKQLAENVVESVVKGDLVVVTGKIRTEEWQDRDSGEKRSKVALIADTVSASLQFRIIPHGEARRTQAPAPANQAYGAAAPSTYGGAVQADEPPF